MTNVETTVLMSRIELEYRETSEGHWLDIYVNDQVQNMLGPFDTEEKRDEAHSNLIRLLRKLSRETICEISHQFVSTRATGTYGDITR